MRFSKSRDFSKDDVIEEKPIDDVIEEKPKDDVIEEKTKDDVIGEKPTFSKSHDFQNHAIFKITRFFQR